jgi:hypothetical protein
VLPADDLGGGSWFRAGSLLGTFRLMFVAVVGVLVLVGNAVLLIWYVADASPEPNRLATAGVVLAGLVSLALPRLLDPGLDCSSDDALVASFRTWFLVRIGVAESASLVGFAAFLATGEPWHYPLGAAFTAVGLVRLAPTDANLARLDERLRLEGCPVSLAEVLAARRTLR